MKTKILAAVLALAATASHAAVSTYSGNDLYSDLQTMDKATSYSFAQGFVYGTWIGTSATLTATDNDKLLFCLPAGVTLSQVMEATKRQLAKDYALRHEEASSFVVKALTATWPCNKPATPKRKQRNDDL